MNWLVKTSSAVAIPARRVAGEARTHGAFRGFVRRRRMLLRIALVLPTLLAAVYFGFFATPRYVSETQIVVRSANSSRVSGLEALFRSFGVARAVDDTNVVQKYLVARDALIALEERLPLREMFGHSWVDVFSRYPRPWDDGSFESFFRYYQTRISAIQDLNRGIITLTAEAFQPEDAKRITEELVRLAEQVVNRMNERALGDAINLAQNEVRASERRLIEAQAALTDFRNAAVLVDPTKTSTSVLETITSLATEMSLTQAQIVEMSRTAPSNPAIAIAQARVEALRARISAERASLAGDDNALATKVSAYERLTLVRDLADKALASAMTSLESARSEALRQQIYVESISAPNLPDQSTEPRRLRLVFMVLVVTLIIYAMFWILSVGTKEHAV
ncbi:Wzz/FepE/Etk N-terminal domain-containing protein [Bosea sp. 117]|uniref:Wzz/FepE/Etk N-terminal domain-containing protein n=1 Tax=Bosea sp. 117 TaxID=1125973 RepID=UPI00068CE2E7|nr:Wzz/FepE/Etk N-terminal domain-containing protein [Bosea sp. 117]